MKEKYLYGCHDIFVVCALRISLYIFVIEKLLDNEVSFMAKIGAKWNICAVALFIVAVIFYGKHLNENLKTELKAKT